MWWWLLTALVVVAALAVLAGGLLRAWRAVRALLGEVGRAGERVAAASEQLNEGLAQAQSRSGPVARPVDRPSADGAALAARVRAAR